MKFTAKYEIVDLLASGRVSTFMVRERATQQLFVVHSFDCPGTLSGNAQQPAIFQLFASLAPSPAGRIVEVGVDDGSVSAYIVTSLPTAAALQNWVRSYRDFAEGKVAGTPLIDENATAELSASEVQAILTAGPRKQNQPPAPDSKTNLATETFSIEQPPSAPVQSKGEFTRLFEDLGVQRSSDTGAQAKSGPAAPSNSIPTGQFEIPATGRVTPSPPVTTKPSGSGPGSFTQEFFLGKKEKDNSGVAGPGTAPRYPTESGAKQPGVFTREFFATTGKGQPTGAADPSRTAPRNGPPAKVSEPASIFGGPLDSSSSAPEGVRTKFDWTAPEAAKSGPGEFTSFFRGPFDQPGSPKKLDTIPNLADSGPARQPTGEFTKIFGNEAREPSKVPGPEPVPERTAGSFTQLFGKDTQHGARLGVSRLDTNPGQSSPPPSHEPPASTTSPVPREPSIFSPLATDPSALKATCMPSPPRESNLAYRPGPADATDVFRVPGGADAPPIEVAPSGPSEFTVFLSRSQVSAALPPEPAIAPSSAPPPFAAPQFAFPTASPVPSVPAGGAGAAPPRPQFMPAAPKPPAAPALPRAASIWPLVTVLTILIAVGAMLVMYFAFKH